MIAGALTFVNGKRIAELALTNHLPSTHAFRETVRDGGLIGMGPDLSAIGRQGARLVSKLLKGEKPADVPVEQPLHYEVYLNLKTAKSLGLEIPPTLLARTNVVIE